MRTHKSPSADLSQWNRRFRLSTITLPPKLKHLSSPHIASPGMRQAAPRLLPIETVSVRSMHADLQAKMSFCETNQIPDSRQSAAKDRRGGQQMTTRSPLAALVWWNRPPACGLQKHSSLT